jgi:glycosyltransferase involved in cell wall biosynthesis
MWPLVGLDMTPAVMSGAGTGRYPRELIRALARRDDVSVLALAASRRRGTGPVSRIAQGLWRELGYYPLGLARRARRLGADLVHCPAAFAARVPDRPLVLTIHDLLPFRYPELFPRVVIAYSRLAWRSAARRAARVITGSEHTRAELTSLVGVEAERVVVTPYGVSERFRPLAPDRDWLGQRFGIDRPFVLCVGTLEPRKNLLTALRAFDRIADETGALLVVAGGAGWGNALFERELPRAAGRVRLTGYVSDEELVRLYSGAGCFLFPSLYEGFGLPVLEAMACGAPVVTGDTSSLPEAAGDAALTVPPSDVEAVADAVKRVLEDTELAADLRRRGLERAATRTWDACAEATVAVYRAALEEAA